MKPHPVWNATAHAALADACKVVRKQVRRFERRANLQATHDLRVAIRRTRAVLKFFTEAWTVREQTRLNDALKATAQCLGPLRDWEASRDLLKASRPQMKGHELRSAATAVLDHAQCEIERILVEKARTISSQLKTLSREIESVLDKPVRGAKRPQQNQKSIHRMFRKRLGDFAHPVARTKPSRKSTPHDWHIYRIQIKKYRYAAELARKYGYPGLHPQIRRLSATQESLGLFHDAVVLEAHLNRAHDGMGLSANQRRGLKLWLAGRQQKLLKVARKQSKRLQEITFRSE